MQTMMLKWKLVQLKLAAHFFPQEGDGHSEVAVPGCGSSWLTARTLAGSSWDPEFWVAHPSATYILDLGSWRPAVESGDRWEV